MPTTSDGTFVYADPAEVEAYVQTQPTNFSLGTTGSPSEWREFLEQRQIDAKNRIDSYCDRDFEDHTGETVTLDGGDGSKRILSIPSPARNVQAVRVEGSALSSDDYVVKESGQLIREHGAPETLLRSREQRHGFGYSKCHRYKPTWWCGYGNIEVDLDWGYQQPPLEIAEAEKKIVDHTLVGMTQKREGMFIEENDISVRVNIPVAMNNEIRAMLDRHKRNEVFV